MSKKALTSDGVQGALRSRTAAGAASPVRAKTYTRPSSSSLTIHFVSTQQHVLQNLTEPETCLKLWLTTINGRKTCMGARCYEPARTGTHITYQNSSDQALRDYRSMP